MALPCDHCENPEYCVNEMRRCLHKGIETASVEGEVTDIEEVNEPELKKRKLGKSPDQPNKKERDFLLDVLNF